jgi:hypothetical protein
MVTLILSAVLMQSPGFDQFAEVALKVKAEEIAGQVKGYDNAIRRTMVRARLRRWVVQQYPDIKLPMRPTDNAMLENIADIASTKFDHKVIDPNPFQGNVYPMPPALTVRKVPGNAFFLPFPAVVPPKAYYDVNLDGKVVKVYGFPDPATGYIQFDLREQSQDVLKHFR